MDEGTADVDRVGYFFLNYFRQSLRLAFFLTQVVDPRQEMQGIEFDFMP